MVRRQHAYMCSWFLGAPPSPRGCILRCCRPGRPCYQAWQVHGTPMGACGYASCSCQCVHGHVHWGAEREEEAGCQTRVLWKFSFSSLSVQVQRPCSIWFKTDPMKSSHLIPPIPLGVWHQVLKVCEHQFLDTLLLKLHDNKITLDEKRYGQFLVAGRVALWGVDYLVGPGHLVNDGGGPSPLHPGLEVVPHLGGRCSSSDVDSSSVYGLRGVALLNRSATHLQMSGAISSMGASVTWWLVLLLGGDVVGLALTEASLLSCLSSNTDTRVDKSVTTCNKASIFWEIVYCISTGVFHFGFFFFQQMPLSFY